MRNPHTTTALFKVGEGGTSISWPLMTGNATPYLNQLFVFALQQHIMIVEGLVLDEVQVGDYTMTCLPLKLQGSEGAPARCILTNPPVTVEDEGLDFSGNNWDGYGDLDDSSYSAYSSYY